MKKIIFLFSVLTMFLFVPTVVLAGNPPDKSQSSYPNFSSTYPADGSTTVSISITLHDSGGSPVVGDVIQLSTSDSTANFPTNNVITDSNGVANFTMTSTTAGTDSITLTDTTTSTTFSNWFNISFYAASTPTATPSDSCSNVPPAPVLTSVVSKSNNNATLTWVDVTNPVSNYTTSYGTMSEKYIYGAPHIGGQGTTSYTVGSLSANKTYYFVVAATNKCGISSFSNEVSVVVNPVPATPAPTAQPIPTSDVSTIASDTPIDIPTDSPIPTVQPSTTLNSTFRDLGIGIIVAGFLLIGSVVVFQMIMKKKNNIPPMHGDNTPQQPDVPTGDNFPQQPQQLEPPIVNNPPTPTNTF